MLSELTIQFLQVRSQSIQQQGLNVFPLLQELRCSPLNRRVHVKFVEETPIAGFGGNAAEQASWTFSSDVCKHCEEAGCLEACPTGAIVRTEFGGVFVQPDICNGCAYCIVSCPFGVVAKNEKDGRAFKCTFCYDRQKAGLKPACAQA